MGLIPQNCKPKLAEARFQSDPLPRRAVDIGNGASCAGEGGVEIERQCTPFAARARHPVAVAAGGVGVAGRRDRLCRGRAGKQQRGDQGRAARCLRSGARASAPPARRARRSP